MVTNLQPSSKPTYVPHINHVEGNELEPIVEGNWVWCPLKTDWRVSIPEEIVRQKYILYLHAKYHYPFEQMDQERRTRHGRKSPKADVVVWPSIEEKNLQHAPIIVVECKSDNISIVPGDYDQGDSYARAIGEPCEFLVMNNFKETRCFRIIRGLPGIREDIEKIPSFEDISDANRMAAIRRATKAFSRDEFRKLLFDCHSILRDNHKMEPGKAFDEISKILFIKMYIERTANHEKFTVSYLDDYARIRRRNLDEVMNDLFDDTKTYYRADDLFSIDDNLAISFATFRRIVSLLERFNLGATSEDIKGIAFERFLGQTFRGDLGQFFTPRPIVDFMVEFLDPSELDIMCDPASGSGGFLIKFFEYVRNKIEIDVHNKKGILRAELETKGLEEDQLVTELNSLYSKLNKDIDVSIEESRLWNVAHKRIFGCDAEPRAARTSKMNMIMHGDGHGGIHHHDGLIDVNGIFENRFDLVLTNPPFGSKVEDDQIIGSTEETKIDTREASIANNVSTYGDLYLTSHSRLATAQSNQEKILNLFDVSNNSKSEKTEILFLERCIRLLKPNGRLGIVVPDGILNNPSILNIRRYLEDRAKILAVISIPDKTFKSSKTNVKASILFLQKYSEDEYNNIQNTKNKKLQEFSESIAEDFTRLSNIYSLTWSRYRVCMNNLNRSRGENLQSALNHYGIGLDEATFLSMRDTIQTELTTLREIPEKKSRDHVRHEFDYEIFMAVADHVGIRASGKEDPINDLPEIISTWRKFLADPNSLTTDVAKSIFKINWSLLDRWDPPSFKPIEWDCDSNILRPIGSVINQRQEPVDRNEIDFSEMTPITIHFDGSIDPRDTSDSDDYTMTLYSAHPGDIVLSKIDLKNGTVGIVPDDLPYVVVTNHFVVYEPDREQLLPEFLIRLIQTDFFKDYLWRKKVGSEGRKEVKIDLFESTLIPIPDLPTQSSIVKKWLELDEQKKKIIQDMLEEEKRLSVMFRNGKSIDNIG